MKAAAGAAVDRHPDSDQYAIRSFQDKTRHHAPRSQIVHCLSIQTKQIHQSPRGMHTVQRCARRNRSRRFRHREKSSRNSMRPGGGMVDDREHFQRRD